MKKKPTKPVSKASKKASPAKKPAPTKKKPLTASTIIKEVRRLAKEYPEAVYCSPKRGCNNIRGTVKDGPEQKGCIVGQACANTGACPLILKKNATTGSYSLLSALNVEWTSKQGHWLGYVQARQDSGKQWGLAVKEVNKMCPGVR